MDLKSIKQLINSESHDFPLALLHGNQIKICQFK